MRFSTRAALGTTALWLGMTGGAVAQDPGAVCEAAMSNVEMTVCLGEAYKKADRTLNTVWTQVLATVDGADYLTADQRKEWETELREAQRAWVKFKEHDCNGAVLYEWWGGSGASAAISSCLLNHTVTRTKDLGQRYLER